MLVLEACGSLVLYTGVTRVGTSCQRSLENLDSWKMRIFLLHLASLVLFRSARCLSPASCRPALSCPTTFPSSAHQWTMLARRLTLAAGTSRGWTMWEPIVLFVFSVHTCCLCEVPGLHSWLLFFFCPLLQAVMPSPLVELRNSNIKRHEISFLEDYAFQQTTPTVSALRDPVCNRVTLVR